MTFSVYGVEPDLTREGGSIPVTLTFQEVTGKNVMLLPVGCGDDGAHSQNEKLNKRNYLNGVCKTIFCLKCVTYYVIFQPVIFSYLVIMVKFKIFTINKVFPCRVYIPV